VKKRKWARRWNVTDPAHPRGPVRLNVLGCAGTKAPFPARAEHRWTPPWVALSDDPPFPAPRQDLIALARKCFPWDRADEGGARVVRAAEEHS
jgi:hypothetical protein